MSRRKLAVVAMLAVIIVSLPGCELGKPVTAENAKGILYVYTSPRCAACKMAKPVVERLKEEGFQIKEIDVNKQPTKAGKAGVHFIPTFIHYYNGKETKRIVGTASDRELRRMFR